MKAKLFSVILAAALAVATLAGCSTGGTPTASSEPTSSASSTEDSSAEASSGETSSAAAAKPTADRAGTPITVPDKVERIISTAPSNTEILIGLGMADKLIMADTYSAGIPGLAEDLPLADFFQPDAEAVLAANPDLVLVSGYNQAGNGDPYQLVKEAGVCVAYIPSSSSVEGIMQDIQFIADVTGTQEAGQKMVSDFQTAVDAVKAIGSTVTEKKTVYFEIASGETLYSFGKGTFLNEFIEAAGAVNIFADQEGWITPSPEAILAANPDIIITTEDYKGDAAVTDIKSRAGWDVLNAVKNNAVSLLGANVTSRPSQNAVLGLQEIAKAIYPDLYQ